MEDIEELKEPEMQVNLAVAYVEEKYRASKEARRSDEVRWLAAYRNYRGVYGPDHKFREDEKSRIFVKITKTKVLAAYQHIVNVLFGGNKFPISIEPTVIPEGVEEAVHFTPANPQMPQQLPELKPGELYDEYISRLGPLEEKLDPVKGKLKKGQGTTPGDITFSPALVAAKNMEKRIHDSLVESNSNKHLRYAAFECALFGTGMMEGPFGYEKEIARWTEKGYDPIIKLIPQVSDTSIWDYYNDPEAYSMEDSECGIRRRRYTKAGLRALKKQAGFKPHAIDAAVEQGPNYQEEWWESQMQETSSSLIGSSRYEVLDFWGYIDEETLESFGVDKPVGASEDVVVNLWVCNNQVIRAVAANYSAFKIPYYRVPYELNPYSFWGIGVAENTDDSQTLCNGFMRMAVDNAMLSGNLIFDIDESALIPGEDLKVHPGKIFRRQSGAPGQAVVGIKFPNTSNENMQMYDKARQLADESTGIPSYSHGQTGVTGIGRTASGISMLMNAAGGSIKSVIKNFDDYLLSPMGLALFNFFKELEPDNKEIQGDLEVKARGTEVLMANEIRSQRLMQFLQLTQSPMLAPFPKMDYIIRELAKSLELDPDKVVNNMSDAALQAELLASMAPQVPTGAETPSGGPPPVSDTAGGGNGNMGIGTAPTPSEDGFSGNVN